MRKKSRYVALKIDSIAHSQIKATADINGNTISDFIRDAIDKYFNMKNAEEEINKKIKDYEKLTSILLEIHNNQKKYFRNLLETLITISPKDKDTIIEIWKGDENE